MDDYEYRIGISKCKMIEEIIEQIAKVIEIENMSKSNIRLHVIKFNMVAYLHSKNANESSKEFIEMLNLCPDDCTDFMCAKICFQELVSTFQSRYISLFLSDGIHNAINTNVDFSKTYDYTVGIGDDSDLDIDNLKSLGNNYFQSIKKNDIENFIIGNIFSDINTTYEDMRISIYVPSYITIDSATSIVHELCDVIPTDINTIPINYTLSKTQNNNLSITIQPHFEHQTIENLDVVLIVDESASMDNEIYDETNIKMPIPDNIVQALETSTIEQQTYDIYTTDTSSVFDEDEDVINYGNKYVKYTFPVLHKVDKFYRLNTLLLNCCDTDKFVIEIEINGVVSRKTIVIENEDIDNINICEELIIIEKAINKINNMDFSLQRRHYIRELYGYVNNKIYKENINTIIENFYMPSDPDVHKYILLIQHIEMLYNSIMTVGERGHEMYNNVNLDSLQHEISTRICRQITQTQSDTVTNSVQTVLEKDCIICYTKQKSIVYNCGHMVACKDCTMTMMYGDQANDSALYNDINDFPESLCPVCRQTITGYMELNITDFKCCVSGCILSPTIICCECKDLIYCKSCWNKEIRNASNKKKRKRLECKCGNNITKYIETIY